MKKTERKKVAVKSKSKALKVRVVETSPTFRADFAFDLLDRKLVADLDYAHRSDKPIRLTIDIFPMEMIEHYSVLGFRSCHVELKYCRGALIEWAGKKVPAAK